MGKSLERGIRDLWRQGGAKDFFYRVLNSSFLYERILAVF